MDDSGAYHHHTVEAFFEIKTYTACNIRYNKKNRITKPPDHRARKIISDHTEKFKKLDKVFA